MSTIKQDRIDFEKLLNGLAPAGVDPLNPVNSTVPAAVPLTTPTMQSPSVSSVIDNTTNVNMPVEKMFEFDYDGTRKGLRKKAKKTVSTIVGQILPADICADEYIQDKMEQDIESLTDLYMQNYMTTLMQKNLVEQVSRGNAMPRNYEVYGQLADKIQNLNKQIISTEQTLRKTYIDIKFELRDKVNEDLGTGMLTDGSSPQNALAAPSGGVVVTSTKTLILNAKARHMDMVSAEKKQE